MTARKRPTLAEYDKLAGELYDALRFNDEVMAEYDRQREVLEEELACARSERDNVRAASVAAVARERAYHRHLEDVLSTHIQAHRRERAELTQPGPPFLAALPETPQPGGKVPWYRRHGSWANRAVRRV